MPKYLTVIIFWRPENLNQSDVSEIGLTSTCIYVIVLSHCIMQPISLLALFAIFLNVRVKVPLNWNSATRTWSTAQKIWYRWPKKDIWFHKLQVANDRLIQIDKQLSGRLRSLTDAMFWLLWEHSLQWRHNDPDGVSHHQPHDCLLNRLFRRRY